MDLITRKSIHNIVEFGSGYSTIVLSEFIRLLQTDNKIESFEHQQLFSSKLIQFCSDQNTIIHTCNLRQLKSGTFEELNQSELPQQFFMKISAIVSEEQYNDTRIKDAFYDFNFDELKLKNIDLIILDGPNGNGRRMCFPLLKNIITLPGYVLLDDYLHYPFLEDMTLIFKYATLKNINRHDKQCLLAKLSDVQDH